MTVCHAWGCMVGCMERISHTNLKIRMVISRIATSKNHIQHEICMFVSTGRVGSCTRILSNDLAGVATPVVILVSLGKPAKNVFF